MNRVVLLILLVMPLTANACYVPPEYLSHPNYILVSSTPNIVLAKVISSKNVEDDISRFKFEVEEYLKGDGISDFELVGFRAEDQEIEIGDYEEHRSPYFWAFNLGNSIQPGDCSAYGVFKEGESYLVFLRGNSHTRAFENVKTKDDLWLNVVKLLINTEKYQESQ